MEELRNVIEDWMRRVLRKFVLRGNFLIFDKVRLDIK